MPFKNRATDLLKNISSFFQTRSSSLNRHDQSYEKPDALEAHHKAIQLNEEQDLFNSDEYKIGFLLGKNPHIREVAIDIGSGVGWFSFKLSQQFKQVIAIEPSKKALEISQQYYPHTLYPNIVWKRGFAEQVLKTMDLKSPVFFLTGVVLSHLRDQEVRAICSQVNRLAFPTSVLCFDECWGTDWHQNRWHVRTQQWWQEQLPGWKLDFHGPEIQGVPGRHKGIHGVKIH